jgi:two-component system, chemotaxis family, sensor kinase CheA
MDEILRDFVVETSENIDLVDSELVRFEKEPNNGAIVAQIFRLVHTVKGTCGFLGLPRLESLAHAAETVISRFRDGVPVTRDAVSLILETIDRIKVIIAAIEQTALEPAGHDADLIERLEQMALLGDKPGPAELEAAPDTAEGSLVYQVLERPLKPGEVSLDELEQAFRETSVAEMPEAAKHLAPGHHAASASPQERQVGVSGIDLKRNTIRVAVDTLEHLMTMVSELVLTRNQLMEIARRNASPEYNMPLQRLSQVTGELQDGVMKTRMQPIGSAWANLPRLVRDLSADLGKEIDLEAVGADTEIDRQLLELIKDPITHMIRNAADHGIELPEERVRAGKPPRGKVRISAAQEGGYIILNISDDGKGLDLNRIRSKAVDLGLVSELELERLSEQQVSRFIFHPGFSTASRVTSVSGRGVGMDVVRTNIEQTGGNIEIRSENGKGTAIVLKIPLTLAIAAALIVTCRGQRFAIPQLAIVEIVRPRAGSDARLEQMNGASVLRLREKLVPVAGLDDLLGMHGGEEPADTAQRFIVICQFENNVYGLAVDSVLQTEEIVVKPASTRLRHIQTYSGTTIMGDGSVIMILDPNGIGGAIGTTHVTEIGAESAHISANENFVESKTALLVFRAGDSGFQAVPLGLVTRLEEVDVTKIERSDGQNLIQYRGKLMPLVSANASVSIRSSGRQPVLVFSYGSRSAGVLVDEIVDIVEEKLEIDRSGQSIGCIGSAIIRGRATDIIDVAALLPFIGDADAPQHQVTSRARTSVLLVDDSDFFRALLTPVLNAAGYKVQAVDNAEQALAFLARHPCDAVVTDLDMPAITGFELAERLRKDARHASLRIVGLSERGGPKTVSRGREVGFDDIVGKFDRQGLIASLLELFQDKRKAA